MDKRNSEHEMNQADRSTGGVGARQESPPAPARGGGYLDICSVSEARFPARMGRDELRRMGLSRMWLDVADVVGPEQFLRVWQVIDQHAAEDYGNLRIRIPRFSRFLRFQRNRYIRTLAQAGYSVAEIQQRVQRELGASLHVESVRKLVYRLGGR